MTTSPFGPGPEASPFGAPAASPFGEPPAPRSGAADDTASWGTAGSARSPFGDLGPSTGGASVATTDPDSEDDFGAVFGGTADPSSSPAPWELSPFGAGAHAPDPAAEAASAFVAPFGTAPTPTAGPTAAVPAPRTAPEDGALPSPAPTREVPGRGGARRVSPLVAVAVAGGAVLAGALGAFALLGSTEGDATSTIAAPAPVSTAAPSAQTPSPSSTASPSAGATTPVTAFVPNPRDPFAALVGGGAAGVPATTAGGAPATSGGGTAAGSTVAGGTTGGTSSGTTGGTSAGGTTGGTSSGTTGGTSTGTTGGTASGTTGGTGTGTSTQLTKAQVCTAVTDPMNQVEQLLTSSATGATGAVDAGLALRNPVAVLRTAVSLTSDSRLAGRLDIAASTAEALRAQLVAGTAVTAGQVATQVSRDADVRTACA